MLNCRIRGKKSYDFLKRSANTVAHGGLDKGRAGLIELNIGKGRENGIYFGKYGQDH